MDRKTIALAVAAALLVAFAAWQVLGGQGKEETGGGAYVPTPPAVTTEAPEPEGHPHADEEGEDHHHGPATLTDAEATAMTEVADEFMRLFVKAGESKDGAWQKTMSHLVEEDMSDLLDTIDPGRVTATKVTGPAELIEADDWLAAVEVPTDIGAFTLYLYRPGVAGNERPVVMDFNTPEGE